MLPNLRVLFLSVLLAGCAGSEYHRITHLNYVPQTLPGAPVANGPPLSALTVVPIDKKVWDEIPKHALLPVCDLRSGTARLEPGFAPAAKGVTEWMAQQATWEKAYEASKTPARPVDDKAPVKLSARASLTVGDEVDVKSVALECAVGKPIVTINGVAYPGDVLYAQVGSSRAVNDAYTMLEVFDRKSGALVGVNLARPLVLKAPPADFANEPRARLSSANVAQYIAESSADPIVHLVPSDKALDDIYIDERFENLFVAPGSSPPSGVYVIAPDEKSLTTSRNVSVNRFVVK